MAQRAKEVDNRILLHRAHTLSVFVHVAILGGEAASPAGSSTVTDIEAEP
jgi:hypothetical protein